MENMNDEIMIQKLNDRDYKFILELIDRIQDTKIKNDIIIKLIHLFTDTIVILNNNLKID